MRNKINKQIIYTPAIVESRTVLVLSSALQTYIARKQDFPTRGEITITELRVKSQVTIPKAIVEKLRLNRGDQLEIIQDGGVIKITPVVVYPKSAVEKFQTEAAALEQQVKNGEFVGYKSIDDLFTTLKS